MIRRESSFDEVPGDLYVVFEARSGLSWGNCFECDNCDGMYPDNAVVKAARAHAGKSIMTIAGAAHLRG